MGYVNLRLSAKGNKRSRKWVVIENSEEMLVHKNVEDYYKSPDKCKRLNMRGAKVKKHAEWDHKQPFYIMIDAGNEGTYEIWTETIREYELWLQLLTRKSE